MANTPPSSASVLDARVTFLVPLDEKTTLAATFVKTMQSGARERPTARETTTAIARMLMGRPEIVQMEGGLE